MLKTAYISTIELRKLLWECADLERDGWTEEGYLRRLHAENEHYISINTTVQAIYREAALRWAKEHDAS